MNRGTYNNNDNYNNKNTEKIIKYKMKWNII